MRGLVRVLIVEDEASMAASLQRGLEAEGYVVEVASDGDDGLWRAVEGSFDAVVLDLMVPKRNGFLVASALRAAGKDVPILVLTAKDGEWDQAEALDRGADDYLTKPFSYPVLLARLRALVRRSRGSTGPELVAGDLRVDPAAHRCWRGDVEIELTVREFALLEALILRTGHVVSKSDLMDLVWGGDLDVTPNAVEVYVGYVRRKIDAAFGRASIETVRGIGYRLVPDAA
jgi:two-component system OmpR family response regulator